MKRLYIGMLLAAMAVTLASCGDGVTKDRGQTQDTGISISAEEEAETRQDIQDQETDAMETGDKAADAGESGTDNETDQVEDTIMKITVGDTTFTAELVDNSSAEALQELLVEGPLTIDMSDYGNMEKVGPIGTKLPRNDEQTTTGAGDIILYQGNSLVIYYDTNSWNFTRIGKIDGVTREELLDAFGEGSAMVTFSLE